MEQWLGGSNRLKAHHSKQVRHNNQRKQCDNGAIESGSNAAIAKQRKLQVAVVYLLILEDTKSNPCLG